MGEAWWDVLDQGCMVWCEVDGVTGRWLGRAGVGWVLLEVYGVGPRWRGVGLVGLGWVGLRWGGAVCAGVGEVGNVRCGVACCGVPSSSSKTANRSYERARRLSAA